MKPPEELILLTDAINKLRKLSDDEKEDLRNRLKIINNMTPEEMQELEVQHRKTYNTQSRELLWEQMSEEDKDAAEKVIAEAENKIQAKNKYVKKALESRKFRAEVNKRTNRIIWERIRQQYADKLERSGLETLKTTAPEF